MHILLQLNIKINKFFKTSILALAGMAQLVGVSSCEPKDCRTAGSIPSRGKCLGCGFSPWLYMEQRQGDNQLMFLS